MEPRLHITWNFPKGISILVLWRQMLALLDVYVDLLDIECSGSTPQKTLLWARRGCSSSKQQDGCGSRQMFKRETNTARLACKRGPELEPAGSISRRRLPSSPAFHSLRSASSDLHSDVPFVFPPSPQPLVRRQGAVPTIYNIPCCE